MEDACSSTVQAHDVDSARQMIQQHQDLKKRMYDIFCPFIFLSLPLSACLCLYPSSYYVFVFFIVAISDFVCNYLFTTTNNVRYFYCCLINF